MLRTPLVLLVLIALLAAATPAAAAPAPSNTTAPPGNSAIDEYLETVPGVSGSVRPRQPGEGPKPTPPQDADLQSNGDDGATLARIVEATAPPARAAAGAPPQTPQTPSAAGRSPLAAGLVAATGTDDGSALGLLLPAILFVSVFAVIVLVRARRRSRP